jgi:S-DNA-T family DNA segregation ATPase FtsK/SpoIIIE
MRRCGSRGITVVLAGDRSTLAGRVTGAATRRYVLRLADRSDYGTAGIPAAAIPANWPAGRALRVPDGAQLQFGFVGSGPDRWIDAVEQSVAAVDDPAPDRTGRVQIRELPDRVHLAEFQDRDPASGHIPFLVGRAGWAAAPLTVDLSRGARTFVVAGAARSGRSTVLISALTQFARRSGIHPAVLAPPRSPLRSAAGEQGIRVLDSGGASADQAGVLLVDDAEHLAGTPAEDWLTERLSRPTAPITVLASVRSDQLAVAYRGLLAELRKAGCALLLQPTAADAELFGIALPRGRRCAVPGRGILVVDPAWGLTEPVLRVQAALP